MGRVPGRAGGVQGVEFWYGWGRRPGEAGKACSPQPPHPCPSEPQFPICKVKRSDPKTAGVWKYKLRAQAGRRLRPDGRLSVSISIICLPQHPTRGACHPCNMTIYKEETEAQGGEDLMPQGTVAGWDPHEKSVVLRRAGSVSSSPLLPPGKERRPLPSR